MTPPDLLWMLTAHGHRLHAPDPDARWERTLCGEVAVRTGNTRRKIPRCRYCCQLTGIPGGYGPPNADDRARPHLGLPQGV